LDEFFQARNHDLVVEGRIGKERALLCVEGKSDEPFDRLIEEKLSSAKIGSNLPERVRRLSMALFEEDDPRIIGHLRYQLLQSVGGALIEARHRRAKVCVFLVHTFLSRVSNDELERRNSRDLDAFIERISRGRWSSVPTDGTLGPISVPGYGSVPSSNRLYIGKAEIDLRDRA
jgi:hypothetical protein